VNVPRGTFFGRLPPPPVLPEHRIGPPKPPGCDATCAAGCSAQRADVRSTPIGGATGRLREGRPRMPGVSRGALGTDLGRQPPMRPRARASTAVRLVGGGRGIGTAGRSRGNVARFALTGSFWVGPSFAGLRPPPAEPSRAVAPRPDEGGPDPLGRGPQRSGFLWRGDGHASLRWSHAPLPRRAFARGWAGVRTGVATIVGSRGGAQPSFVSGGGRACLVGAVLRGCVSRPACPGRPGPAPAASAQAEGAGGLVERVADRALPACGSSGRYVGTWFGPRGRQLNWPGSRRGWPSRRGRFRVRPCGVRLVV